jgi:NAD-dependent dihydropyrimidine dehydrogenase PreA subunit
MFLFYVLFPSIETEQFKNVDTIISPLESSDNLQQSEKKINKDKKAFVLCNSDKIFNSDRIKYNSLHTCTMVKSVMGSGTDCKFSCIGLGDCAKVCPQEAIYFENKTAKISSLCIGCGKCIDVCPNNIIKLIPVDTKEIVICSNCSEETMSTCNCKQKSNKVEWILKKDFKIWLNCYRIVSKLKNLIKRG